MTKIKKFYQLVNGYPLRVEIVGPYCDFKYPCKVLENYGGYLKGEIIEVPNLFLFDKR